MAAKIGLCLFQLAFQLGNLVLQIACIKLGDDLVLFPPAVQREWAAR